MKDVKLAIKGMTCSHCEQRVRDVARSYSGVEEIVAVSAAEGVGRFLVRDDLDALGLARAVTDAGFESAPVAAASRGGASSGRDYDLVVVGGGSAGFAAAIRGAELGARVALVNAGPLGGTCVNVGCVPSKTLIRAAELHHRARHHRFGGIVCRSQTSDWPLVLAEKDALVDSLRTAKYWEVLRAYEGITLVEGRARVGGDATVAVGEQSLRAGRVVVTTGSRPFVPPILGLEDSGYLDSEAAMALPRLPGSMAVLGAGAIGLELAQAFARFGVKVTVVEVARQVAPLEDAEAAAELARHLSAEGLDLRTGVKVQGVRRDGDERVLSCQGAEGRAFDVRAEALLVATGRQAVTAGLGLEAAGVRLGPRGEVLVDERMATSNPTIYAAGDCTNLPQFVYVAAAAGHLAAENALQESQRSLDLSVTPRVTFTDPQMASVGVTEAEALAQGLGVKVARLSLEHVPRALAARDTRGLIKLVAEERTGRILGAQIVAPEAGEMIMEPTLAVRFRLTVEDLVQTLHPYLTLGEGVKLCAQTFTKDVLKLSCCAG